MSGDRSGYLVAGGQHEIPRRFEVVTVRQIQVPGLPAFPMLADAERLVPDSLPRYNMSRISTTFFVRYRTWLRNVLSSVKLPPEGTDVHFPHPVVGGVGYQTWTLADVERMIEFLFRVGKIDYDHQVVSRQIVAWTARGLRLLQDTKGTRLG